MDHTLIQALMSGMELRIPNQDLTIPIDFIVVGDSTTLVFRADWWTKESESGVGVVCVNAVPREITPGQWTFDHMEGYLLAGPSDEDQESYLRAMRTRMDLNLGDYLDKLHVRSQGESEYDFSAWIEAAMARPQVLLDQVIENETRERAIGKILLRNGSGSVVDSLVIDEGGLAATANEDGHLARFAEQWVSYTVGERPSMSDFIQWLGTQSIYGSFVLDGAGVVSTAGDIQEIALQLASDSL